MFIQELLAVYLDPLAWAGNVCRVFNCARFGPTGGLSTAMATTIGNLFRLARAGVVFARYGVSFVPKGMPVPLVLRLGRLATLPISVLSAPFRTGQDKTKRVSEALITLGPSYIKLGQFLATRADVIGTELASDLANLQDKLPPFSMAEARRAIEESLGGTLEDHFVSFGPPVAAASIAQVHKAEVIDENGEIRAMAVKILRPGVERRFRHDLDSYYFAARMVERFHPPSRRLRPVAVVDTLKILIKIKDYYEQYHKVRYIDETIVKCV